MTQEYDEDDFTKLIDDMTLMRECLWCYTSFTDEAATGRHECRRHTGIMQTVMRTYDTELDTYSCCGVSPTSAGPNYQGRQAALGCVVCDHSDEPGIPEDYTIPLVRARILYGDNMVNERHVIVHGDGLLVTIKRSVK